jgi:hypothetical protein
MTASSRIREPGTEATMVLRRYLDALTAGDLDAIVGSFVEDATWLTHGTPRIPADTAWPLDRQFGAGAAARQAVLHQHRLRAGPPRRSRSGRCATSTRPASGTRYQRATCAGC